MLGKSVGLRALWLVAGCVALGVGLAPAFGKHAKVDPLTALRNDPHSSAWLNREAAKRARKAGVGAHAPATLPPRLATPTVNNPAADATNQDTQSETTIADLGAGHLVAGFNDSGSYVGPSAFTGYSWSDDNGVSWNDAGTLPNTAAGNAGDPVLAYDKTFGGTGKLYFVTLGLNSSALQMFASIDKGHTFAPATSPGGIDADKAWATVDNFAGSGQHNLYVCYTEFSGTEEIRFTRSTDIGASFSPPISLAGPAGQVQGCFVTVSPNHQVNVYYFSGGGSNNIYVRRSNDLGVSFSAPVLVAHLHTTTTNGDIGALGGFRTNTFPHAAVIPNPSYPFQYVVFNDIDPAVPGNKSDIYLVRSIDGGVTWSPPQVVNNDLAGDQYMPTIAATAGRKLMIGYYSRSHDPANLAFHRRGVLGTASTSGAAVLRKSFQMGPDTPIAIGQDPVIVATYMGDYDQIAAGAAFSSTWADNRFGNGFHAHQPDVHYGRIASSAASGDLSVSVTHSPAQIGLGENAAFTVTVSASGADASDVFVNITPGTGLAIQAMYPNGAVCYTYNSFTGCSFGTISAGNSRSIQIVAKGVVAPGSRLVKALATMSNPDTNNTNNAATDTITVSDTYVVSKFYSTGNVAIPLADQSTEFIPFSVPDQGLPVRMKVYVRLDHTFDSDLTLTLISPMGKSVVLSQGNGGSGDNYGSGNANCSGSFTIFDDAAPSSITTGVAPFVGTFKPQTGQFSDTYGDPIDGQWKLKIDDTAGGDTGTLYCAKLQILQVQ